MTVGLQRGEEDVEEPQADEQHGGQDLGSPRPAQLAADLRPPPVHQRGHADEGKDGEERDGEGQPARVHSELVAFAAVVDGGDGPRHLQEECGEKHVALTVSVFIVGVSDEMSEMSNVELVLLSQLSSYLMCCCGQN